MKRIIFFTGLLLFTVNFWACKKEENKPAVMTFGINPATEKNATNAVLQLEGHLYKGPLPKDDTLFLPPQLQPQITLISELTELSEGIRVNWFFEVPGFPNPFARLCGFYFKVKGADTHWKTPLVTSSANYNVSFLIPKMVNRGKIDFTYRFAICFNNKVYYTDTTNTSVEVLPAYACNDTVTGGYGLNIRKFKMTDKKGKVKISIRTGFIGDRIDVKQGSNWIFSTGTLLLPNRFPNCNSDGFISTSSNQGEAGPFQSFLFDYDPKNGQILDVFGYGNCGNSNSEWTAILYCPQ